MNVQTDDELARRIYMPQINTSVVVHNGDSRFLWI